MGPLYLKKKTKSPLQFFVNYCLYTLIGFFSFHSAFGNTTKQNTSISKPAMELSVYASPLVIAYRLTEDEFQETKGVQPKIYGLGLKYKLVQFNIDHGVFPEAQTSVGTLTVNQKKRETLLWTQYQFWEATHWGLSCGLGVGTYDEEITSKLGNGASSVAKQGNKFIYGAAATADFWVAKYFLLNGSVRIMDGDDYSPRPQWEGVIKLGLRIPLEVDSLERP